MDKFLRRFEIGQLAAWHSQNRGSGLAALFSRWALPGADAGTHGLRVAIRNGYLNLYVKGQSVAELRMLGGYPRLKVHAKYLDFAENGSDAARDLGQQYGRITADDLMLTNYDTVDRWIRTAETYAGDEKRFVDDLVAVTPGTLDLEMGLPADDSSKGKDRSAPRMDLVVAQDNAIIFWEAKCAINGEMRARAPFRETPDGGYLEGPHVLWQLRRYQKWVGRPHRAAEVRDAYVATARQLLELAEVFEKDGPAIHAWRSLVDAGDGVTVVLPPGIVVADYCPARADGSHCVEAAPYAAKAASFGAHEARLIGHGATVMRVPAKPSKSVLPDLCVGSISDVEQPA